MSFFSSFFYLFLSQRLRDIALKEQTKMSNAGTGFTPTLLGLTNSLSRFVNVSYLNMWFVVDCAVLSFKFNLLCSFSLQSCFLIGILFA